LILGVLLLGVDEAASRALPRASVDVLLVVLLVLITGGLHLDGLSDAADGLLGGQTPERRLEIMRDSRLGTYGVLAIVFLIAAKLVLLAPLDLMWFARAVAAGMVLGRASSLPPMRWLTPAAGSTAALAGTPSTTALAVGGLTALVTVVVAFGRWSWLPLLVAAAVTLVAAWVVRRRLGGINGDTLGATNQLVEVATYACAAALAI
jgi:adenosylcobinamide-GDP ribazoletransferase